MKNSLKWLIALIVVVGIILLASGKKSSANQQANVIDAFINLFKSSPTTNSGIATTGNGAPSGPHYNLNLIGVPKDKTAPLTDSSGHRIFVPLAGKCRIDLAMGTFAVLDGNCTDGPAKLQLPDPDPNGDGVTAYSVYVRALGKPGGKAVATSCVDTPDGTYCSTDSVVLVRNAGKPTFMNASKDLLTVCMDTNGDGICDVRQYIFDDSANNYFWNYDNTGLRNAQFRFYEVPTNIGLTP